MVAYTMRFFSPAILMRGAVSSSLQGILGESSREAIEYCWQNLSERKYLTGA
jgi:hypothetical protein